MQRTFRFVTVSLHGNLVQRDDVGVLRRVAIRLVGFFYFRPYVVVVGFDLLG